MLILLSAARCNQNRIEYPAIVMSTSPLPIPPQKRTLWLLLAAILALYALMLIPTLTRQGISWDEQTDIDITRAYLKPDGWLAGSDSDPSQTRLPMFTVALVYKLLGTDDLLTGRFVSVLIGGLTILGIYVYGARTFGKKQGLLAALLLASSPFFLSFARIAFTESDIYLACTLAWLMVALSRFQEKPTLGRAAVSGILLGLCISAKFTALTLLPAVWMAVYSSRNLSENGHRSLGSAILGAWSLALAVGAWAFANATSAGDYTPSLRRAHYLLVLAGWLVPLAWAYWNRAALARRWSLGLFITGIAILTFLVLPPEHLTNPDILRSMIFRAQGEMDFDPGFIVEAVSLHAFSILFKSSPLVGLTLLAAPFLALLRVRKQPALVVPLLVIGGYAAGLAVLPIAQTFYTIPLLGLLALLAAEAYVRLSTSRRRISFLLLSAAVIGLSADVAMSYPDYNLNGYQYLGDRVLVGRSSVGYRSVVQTTSDGVQQAFEYLNAHAQPHERVNAYVMEWHIVQATAPDAPYTIQNGYDFSRYERPQYIVIHINGVYWQGWGKDNPVGEIKRPPYDEKWLAQNYEMVFSVPRTMGLTVASVWKRLD